MNEFSALRLGDVLAIEQVGLDTVEKERLTFNELFGEDRVGGMILAFRHNIEILDYVITRANSIEPCISQSKRTATRLFNLREHYLRPETRTELDVSTWIGIFCGVAITSWELVKGIFEQTDNEDLQNLCEKCLSTYEKQLRFISEQQYRIGLQNSYK